MLEGFGVKEQFINVLNTLVLALSALQGLISNDSVFLTLYGTTENSPLALLILSWKVISFFYITLTVTWHSLMYCVFSANSNCRIQQYLVSLLTFFCLFASVSKSNCDPSVLQFIQQGLYFLLPQCDVKLAIELFYYHDPCNLSGFSLVLLMVSSRMEQSKQPT